MISDSERFETVPLESVTRIEWPVKWRPGHTAAYIIDCGSPVMIDAGMTGVASRRSLETQLQRAGIALSDIKHVIVTHPHGDHLGQVSTLLDYEVDVHVPTSIRPRFNTELDRFKEPARRTATAAGVVDPSSAVETDLDRRRQFRNLLPINSVSSWFSHGDILDLGSVSFEVIHTPGHQVDHCCFLARIDGLTVLFSGDMGLASFRPIALHSGINAGSLYTFDAFYMALSRLKRHDVELVLPAHGSMHSSLQATIDRDESSLQRALKTVREHVGDGANTAFRISQREHPEFPRVRLAEAIGSLSWLERSGHLCSRMENNVRHYASVDGRPPTARYDF